MKSRWLDIPPAHLTRKILRRLFRTLIRQKAEFTIPVGPEPSAATQAISASQAAVTSRPVRKRGRSLAIRVVDCGSDGAAEQEILAMFNPVYDAERFGLHLVTSPRHADVLLVSGPLARNMEAALLAAFEAMPEPRRVVTIGDDLEGLGGFHDSYGITPLLPALAAVRVAHVPGNPPSPADILAVLLAIDWH